MNVQSQGCNKASLLVASALYYLNMLLLLFLSYLEQEKKGSQWKVVRIVPPQSTSSLLCFDSSPSRQGRAESLDCKSQAPLPEPAPVSGQPKLVISITIKIFCQSVQFLSLPVFKCIIILYVVYCSQISVCIKGLLPYACYVIAVFTNTTLQMKTNAV